MKTELGLITVDYSLSISNMIQLARFDSVADCLKSETNLKLFPIDEELIGTRVEVKQALFNFDKKLNKNKAIAGMKREGYRQATLPELLALAIEDPELQRKFSIVALAAKFKGNSISIMAHGLQRFSNSTNIRALVLCSSEIDNYSHYLAVAI
ncbi:MAG TPA: hypothetical protein VIK86_03380 [Candidatus Paceibacterota bacterium]